MNRERSTHEDPTITVLRTLDPAASAEPRVSSAVAQESLAAILASDLHPVPSTTDLLESRPRSRRWLVLVAAATAGALALAIGPQLGGGDAAFASWTSTPNDVTPTDLDAAAAGCRTFLTNALPPDKPDSASAGTDDGAPTSADIEASTPVIAERRGDWTFVLMSSAGFEISCLTSKDRYGSGAIDSSTNDAPPAREVRVTALGASLMDDEGFVSVNGLVGKDVTGVVVHTADRDLRATVKAGRFLAWWPQTVEREEPPFPTIRLTLTFADGSIKELSAQESQPLAGHGTSSGGR